MHHTWTRIHSKLSSKAKFGKHPELSQSELCWLSVEGVPGNDRCSGLGGGGVIMIVHERENGSCLRDKPCPTTHTLENKHRNFTLGGEK